MSNLHIENLEKRVADMEMTIDSQKKLLNSSLECLAQIKASVAVTNMVKRKSGEFFTLEEQELYHGLINEAYENSAKLMLALGGMEKELRELNNEIIMSK